VNKFESSLCSPLQQLKNESLLHRSMTERSIAAARLHATPKRAKAHCVDLSSPAAHLIRRTEAAAALSTPPPPPQRKRSFGAAPVAGARDSVLTTPAKSNAVSVQRSIGELFSPSPARTVQRAGTAQPATSAAKSSSGILHGSPRAIKLQATAAAAATAALAQSAPVLRLSLPADEVQTPQGSPLYSPEDDAFLQHAERSDLCVLEVCVPSQLTIAGVALLRSWTAGDLKQRLFYLGHLNSTEDVTLRNRCSGEVLVDTAVLGEIDTDDTLEARYEWECIRSSEETSDEADSDDAEQSLQADAAQ
jgi:hypothetical protein